MPLISKRITLTRTAFWAGILLSGIPWQGVFGQTDTIPGGDAVELWLEETANELQAEEIDYNALFEPLEEYRYDPLNLNEASESDLAVFPFLTPIQIASFISYRQSLGPLVSLYELQAIPEWDLSTIRQILPFVRIGQPNLQFGQVLRQSKSAGRHLFIARWSRYLERSKGFDPSPTGNAFLGDPNRLYLRYRFQVMRRLSVGLTAEKDAGEPFFRPYNKFGFDYYSAHLQYRQNTGWLRNLILGDFEISMGQGLLLWQSFSTGKSSLTTLVKRAAPFARPHAGVNEVVYQRGLALSIALSPKIEAGIFLSRTKRDANLLVFTDTLQEEPLVLDVSSLQTSGLHRTPSELADRRSLTHAMIGGKVEWKPGKWSFSLNGVYHSLDKALNPTPVLYNAHYFRGTSLLNLSLDYAYTWQNAHLFGETALSDNGSVASINGLLVAFGRGSELSFVHRYFPKDYHSIQSNAFGESRTPRNEQGFYIGMVLHRDARWSYSAYFDMWKNPWPRFGNDAPSTGHEWMFRIYHRPTSRLETYVQVKSEVKDANLQSELHLSPTLPRTTSQIRLHFSLKLNKALEWRTRLDLGRSSQGGESQDGMALLQDLLYRPPFSPISLMGRYAVFGTGSYDVRFYHFENDVLYSFSIPAYYGNGSRFYLKLRYKIRRGPQIELRYARSFFPNQQSVGSGLDTVPGPARTEVKCQLLWQI